jgi:hypothetical protein
MKLPVSYQLVYSEPETSDNFQRQSQSIVLTSNDQYRQPLVSLQPTPGQPFVSVQPIPNQPFVNVQSTPGQPFVNVQSTPGQPFVGVQPTPGQPIYNIKSHIFWSIFNIVFCCLCFGCVACWFGKKTNDLKKQGDIQGALKASKKARLWNNIATIVGCFLIMFQILFLSNQHVKKHPA